MLSEEELLIAIPGTSSAVPFLTIPQKATVKEVVI
jgi:hypothetical protein